MSPALDMARNGRVLRVRASGVWNVHALDGGGKGSRDIALLIKGGDRVRRTVEQGAYQTLAFEAEDVERWDSSLLLILSRLASAARHRKREVDSSALPEGMARLLSLAAEKPALPGGEGGKGGPPPARHHAGLLELIGDKALAWPGISIKVTHFLGGAAISLGRFFTGRAALSRRDMWTVFRECGVDALPIVSLTSLLLGLILAFVSSIQLRNFGAEVYTAALVGVAMLRVMGPVLTGIVLAGRTGASFAAIIGSMQVNEEVDALVTFGVDPVDFLVLPRVLGLAIMTPLLAVYADIMGILGGFMVGVSMMGISPAVYIENTINNITLNHFAIGLFHSFVFGFVVSLAGCYQGMKSGRSAEAVGGATTAAVVNAIVGIIVSTSIITVVLTVIHL